jgi:hypothetical protein
MIPIPALIIGVAVEWPVAYKAVGWYIRWKRLSLDLI